MHVGQQTPSGVCLRYSGQSSMLGQVILKHLRVPLPCGRGRGKGRREGEGGRKGEGGRTDGERQDREGRECDLLTSIQHKCMSSKRSRRESNGLLNNQCTKMVHVGLRIQYCM